MLKRLFILSAVSSTTFNLALAQGGFKSFDPNLGHFYMARQEWQYIEDSPVVTGQPGAGQQMPARPAILPKAGWIPYSSTIPSVQSALPKVENGVPKPMPAGSFPAAPALKGRAGSIKARRPASTGSPPGGLRTYAPYRGYGAGAAPSAASGSSASSSTHVKGSVLHWARPKVKNY